MTNIEILGKREAEKYIEKEIELKLESYNLEIERLRRELRRLNEEIIILRNELRKIK